MKVLQSTCLLLTVALCRAADVRQIQEMYRAIIHSEDDSRLPRPEDLSSPEMEDSVKALSGEDARSLLPLAEQCLQSARPGVRKAGLVLLIGMDLRPDSAELLEPYVDGLGKLLAASDGGVRSGVIYVLGSSQPVASPRAVAYLIAHLADKGNTAGELSTTAAAVLKATAVSAAMASRPPDSATVHQVLAAVDQRPELKLKGDVIHMLGVYRITNEDALQAIGAGLKDADRFVRENSIDAAERMPREARGRFIRDLQRIAGDPQESPSMRARAASVLNSQ